MDDQVGEQFGDYRLIRRLGGGSFGDVYLAEHIKDKTQVAVKVLNTDEEDIAAYINEIRALFRLRHENIVPLLDFGIKQKIPFFVMAYASNGTLRQFRGKKIPLNNVVNLVRQIAEALQYAHDKRIIHRDVKPENVLLGPQFQVWLSDFGIAGVAHSLNSLDKNQKKVGTLAYMAPEQAEGEPVRASDQYSLGIMAYEWICGNRPLDHRTDDPPPLREFVPDLPAAVEEVILTALAKNPKQRFGSVRAFATALEQAARVPTIPPSVETKQNDKREVKVEPINSPPEVKNVPVPLALPVSSSSVVEPLDEKRTLGLDEPEPSIAPGRVDKVESKLAINDEPVMRQVDSSEHVEHPDEDNAKKNLPLFNRRPKSVLNASAPAPLESFHEAVLPPPQPFAVPIPPLSVPSPIVAVSSNDDDKRMKPLLPMLPLEQGVTAEDNVLTTEQHAFQQQNYQRLYAALAQLAPDQQQLIQLRYGKGMRLVAIAELLGKTEDSVREMLAAILHQLHTIL